TLAVRMAVAILRPRSASTRFAIWFITLIGVAALPPVLFIRTIAFGLAQFGSVGTLPVSRTLGPGVLTVWGFVAVLLLLRLGINYLRLLRWQSLTKPAPPEL